MISSLVFLRRGVAAENPTIYKMTDEEYTRLQELAGEQVDLAKEELDAAKAAEKAGVTMDTDGSDESDDEEDSDEEVAHAKKAAKVIKAAAQTGKPTDPSDLAEYNLDDYDGDGDAPESRLFSNISALSVPAAADPYLDLTGEDSDEEDLRMLPSDSMIVAARTEDDLSQVEVYVYERGESNLYVRNDWMVPGMPLCMEWLDFGPGGEKGSYIAIGSYDPVIELWNLDIVDGVLPVLTLGTPIPKKTGKKKSKIPQVSSEQHVGAILSLSWNSAARNLLASGSADNTVKLWDLNSPSAAAASYGHHTAPVQAIQFDPARPPILLTGSHDQTAWVLDSRAPQSGRSWKLGSDVECARWATDEKFLVSCEDGTVRLYDTRAKGSAPEWTLQAHEKPVSGLDLHPTIAGMMVTSSPDRTSKIWDIASGKPKLVLSRDLGAGQVFGASFSPDFAGLVVGGTGGKVVVWDTEENAVVRRAFEGRIAEDEVLKAALADEEEGGEGEGRKGRREVVATEDGEGSEGDSDDSEDDGEGEEEEDEDDDEMEED